MLFELFIIAIIIVLAVMILKHLLGFAIKFIYYALVVFVILTIISFLF